jgi:hypothetical protein
LTTDKRQSFAIQIFQNLRISRASRIPFQSDVCVRTSRKHSATNNSSKQISPHTRRTLC